MDDDRDKDRGRRKDEIFYLARLIFQTLTWNHVCGYTWSTLKFKKRRVVLLFRVQTALLLCMVIEQLDVFMVVRFAVNLRKVCKGLAQNVAQLDLLDLNLR